jgi:hypothetical protein
MNWRPFFVIACGTFLSACTHTSNIGYERGKTSPEEMFRRVEGKDVVVTLRNAARRVGNVRSTSLDTMHLLEVDSVNVTELPIVSIRNIRLEGSTLGPVGGLLTGGVVGALIGSGTASNQGRNEPFHDIAVGASGVLGGTIGAIIGLLIGAEITPSYEFLLP